MCKILISIIFLLFYYYHKDMNKVVRVAFWSTVFNINVNCCDKNTRCCFGSNENPLNNVNVNPLDNVNVNPLDNVNVNPLDIKIHKKHETTLKVKIDNGRFVIGKKEIDKLEKRLKPKYVVDPAYVDYVDFYKISKKKFDKFFDSLIYFDNFIKGEYNDIPYMVAFVKAEINGVYEYFILTTEKDYWKYKGYGAPQFDSKINEIKVIGRGFNDLSYMFSNCTILEHVDLNAFDITEVENMSHMFFGCEELVVLDFGSYSTPCLEDMSSMFCGCSGLTEIDLHYFDTRNVIDMSNMFKNCSYQSSIFTGELFNTQNVVNMQSMFENAGRLESYPEDCLDVSKLDTRNVVNMSKMFAGCRAESLDLSENFDTSNVTNMESMFAGCSDLESLDLSENFDTSNVTNMKSMFAGCSKLESLDLPENFDTSNVTNMESMFDGCKSLASLNISVFDFNGVEKLDNMFKGCVNLQKVIVNENDKILKELESIEYCSNIDYMRNRIYVHNSYSVDNLQPGDYVCTINVLGRIQPIARIEGQQSLDRKFLPLEYKFEYKGGAAGVPGGYYRQEV